MARWRLDVAYDGTRFHGFAAQPGQRTVAGELQLALDRLCRLGGEPRLVCAGRTDAGVHALAQVVHVDLPDGVTVPRSDDLLEAATMQRHLNAKLPSDVVVTRAQMVEDAFDARHSATERSYRYLIDVGRAADPLLVATTWHVDAPLNRAHMDEATALLIGEHDFRSFCRRTPGTTPEDPLMRRVHRAAWSDEHRVDHHLGAGPLLRFDIAANAFCHRMVRSLVGQLVAIGLGHSSVAELRILLTTPDRHRAADPAPGKGLCLIGVEYGHGEPQPGCTVDDEEGS